MHTRYVITLVITAFMLLTLIYGSVVVIEVWLRGPRGEEAGWVFVLYWPLTWLVSGVLAIAGLLLARRMKDGLMYLALLWGGDIIVWWFVLPSLDRVDKLSIAPILSIVVFDAGALLFVWWFLLRAFTT